MDWRAQQECLGALGRDGHFRHLFNNGSDHPMVSACVVAEEIAYRNYALETTVASSLSCAKTLELFATPEIRQGLLPDLLSGKTLCAIGMTEPEAGSDTSRISTSIESQGENLVVNGFKRYISNASVADFYLVYGVSDPQAKPSEKLSVVLLPKDCPGLSTPKVYQFMGRRGSVVGEVKLENCRVPQDHLIGTWHQGFKIMLKLLNFERILLGASALGVARSAFDLAVTHAENRVAFGQPLGCKQLIWDKVAEMSWRLEAARLMNLEAAQLYDRGTRGKELMKNAALTKLVSSETAVFCADQAVQILGGDGLSQEGGRVEQIYRDARALPIAGGTSEILKYLIAGREMPELKLNL